MRRMSTESLFSLANPLRSFVIGLGAEGAEFGGWKRRP
jgi:hypothetical protein